VVVGGDNPDKREAISGWLTVANEYGYEHISISVGSVKFRIDELS